MKREYAKSLKVGDIVYAYYKGLWVIESVEERESPAAPLVGIRKIATDHLMPCKQVLRKCDISWCRSPLQSTLDYARVNGVSL